MVNYPLLAYKSAAPDNKEIILVHLAHNMPQRSIHLGNYEFISFVKGNYEEPDTRKEIILLVRDRKRDKIKMLIIFYEPWKSNPSEIKEEIYDVQNSNLFMPTSE